MQKFKIQREKLVDALPGVEWRDLQYFPDFIVLEGELLEGGTVEKCCEFCKRSAHILSTAYHCGDSMCSCHNKKEDEFDIQVKRNKAMGFNRETPKVELTIVPSGRIDYCVNCDAEHGYDCPKEEVKLPEMIGWYSPGHADSIVVGKVNEILTYLASKENK